MEKDFGLEFGDAIPKEVQGTVRKKFVSTPAANKKIESRSIKQSVQNLLQIRVKRGASSIRLQKDIWPKDIWDCFIEEFEERDFTTSKRLPHLNSSLALKSILDVSVLCFEKKFSFLRKSRWRLNHLFHQPCIFSRIMITGFFRFRSVFEEWSWSDFDF